MKTVKHITCSVYRDALNFRPPKTPHRQAVFRFHSPPAVITAPCDAPFNIPLYQYSSHAHRKSRVRSNNAPTGNFYVVYLFLFAVALLYIFDLYYLYFYVLLLVFSVICMHQWSESNAISILCMYGTCGRIDNKADFDFDF